MIRLESLAIGESPEVNRLPPTQVLGYPPAGEKTKLPTIAAIPQTSPAESEKIIKQAHSPMTFTAFQKTVNSRPSKSDRPYFWKETDKQPI